MAPEPLTLNPIPSVDPLALGYPAISGGADGGAIDWPWPLSSVGWWAQAVWDFVGDTFGAIGRAVDGLLRPLYINAYSWMRGRFLPLAPLGVQADFPEASPNWTFDDVFGRMFRLPFEAILKFTQVTAGNLYVSIAQTGLFGNVSSILGQVGDLLGRIPSNLGGDINGLAGGIAGILGRIPGDLGNSIGSILGQLGDLLGRIPGDLGGDINGLAGGIAGILGRIPGDLGNSIGSILGQVGDLIGRIPGDLGGILAAVRQAVTVDLPHTLGGLAQAVSDRIAPIITNSIAGLGDLAGKVRDLVRPLTDAISAAVANLSAATAGTLSGLTSSVGRVATAVMSTIPDLVGGIIPTLTGALSGVQSVLQSRLSDLGTSVTGALAGAQAALQSRLSDLGASLAGVVNGAQAALQSRLSDLGTSVTAALSTVQSALQDKISTMTGSLTGLFNTVETFLAGRLADIQRLVDQLPTNLPDLVLGKVRDLILGVAGQARDLIRPLTDALGSAIAGIPGQARDLVRPLTDGVDAAIAAASALVQAVPGQVKNLVQPLIAPLGIALTGIPLSVQAMLSDATSTILRPIAGAAGVVDGALQALQTLISNLGDALGAVGHGLDGLTVGVKNGVPYMWTPGFEDVISNPLDRLAGYIDQAPASFDPGSLGAGMPQPARSILGVLGSVLNYGGRVLDAGMAGMVGLLKGQGYMSPATAFNSLGQVQALTRDMALGLSGMAIASETMAIWKHLGIGQLSAILWEMTNFKLITGAAIGALAAVSLETPLNYYYNDLFRPVIPGIGEIVSMRGMREIDEKTFEQWIGYHGFHPDIVERMKDDVWKVPMVRQLGSILDAVPEVPPLPADALANLAQAGLHPEDPAEAWISWKLVRAAYHDYDIALFARAIRTMPLKGYRNTYLDSLRRLYAAGYLPSESLRAKARAVYDILDRHDLIVATAEVDAQYQDAEDTRRLVLASMTKGLLSPAETQDALESLGVRPAHAQLQVLSNRLGLLPRMKEGVQAVGVASSIPGDEA